MSVGLGLRHVFFQVCADLHLAYSNYSITPLASFLIYSLNAKNHPGETLTTSRAFTSLTLFSLLSTPISNLVEGVTGIATGIGSLKRIDSFLKSPLRDFGGQVRESALMSSLESTMTIADQLQPTSKPPRAREKNIPKTPSISSHEGLPAYDCLVKADFLAEGLSTGWEENKPLVINEASFEIHRGTVTMIVGPVGCGKSTFVRMLLHETPILTGKLHVEPGAIAYCAQTPWLVNTTMQDNILGESLFDLNWYNVVLEACALEEDIKFMANRDQGLLGTGGASLSGGQKQRVVSPPFID